MRGEGPVRGDLGSRLVHLSTREGFMRRAFTVREKAWPLPRYLDQGLLERPNEAHTHHLGRSLVSCQVRYPCPVLIAFPHLLPSPIPSFTHPLRGRDPPRTSPNRSQKRSVRCLAACPPQFIQQSQERILPGIRLASQPPKQEMSTHRRSTCKKTSTRPLMHGALLGQWVSLVILPC